MGDQRDVQRVEGEVAMQTNQTKPCRECPFRRASAPGYVGSTTPEQFMDTVMQDYSMPCHLTVDYENENWEDDLDLSEQCAGAAIFFANICKLSRDKTRMRLSRDTELVFSSPQEFLAHHEGSGK